MKIRPVFLLLLGFVIAVSIFSNFVVKGELNAKQKARQLVQEGWIQEQSGMIQESQRSYSRALELDPKCEVAYKHLGTSSMRLSKYEDALKYFNKAAEINPNHASIFYNRGILHIQLGNYDQAIADNSKAIELNPGYAAAYQNRAVAYLQKNDFKNAIPDYEKLLEFDPQNAQAYFALATCYAMTKQFEKAKEITYTKLKPLDEKLANEILENILTPKVQILSSLVESMKRDSMNVDRDQSKQSIPKNISDEPIETIGIKPKDIPFSTYGLTVDQFLPNNLSARVHGKGITVLKKVQKAIKENRISKISCKGCFTYGASKEDNADNFLGRGLKDRCLEHELQSPLREDAFRLFEDSSYGTVNMSNPADSYEFYNAFGNKPIKLNIQIEDEKNPYQFTFNEQKFDYYYAEDIEHNKSDKIWYYFYYSAPQYQKTLVSLSAYCLPYDKETLTEEEIKDDPNLSFFYYSEQIKKNPADLEALYQRALISLTQYNPRQAEEDFNKIFKIDPNHFGANLGIGKAISHPHDLKETNQRALPYFNKALQLSPQNAEVYFERGKLYRYLNDTEKSLMDLTQAISLKKDYSEAYFQRGELNEYYLKDAEKAIEDYSHAVRSDPNYFPAYSNRARLYKAAGNYEAAITDQTRLMTKDYRYWISAFLNRAELYELTSQFEKAITDYKSLIEEHGYRAKVSVLLRMIPVYFKMGQYNEAIEDSTRVLSEQSQQWEQVEAYTYRAVAYYHLNEFDKSWADIAKIKEWGKEFKYADDPGFLEKLKKASGREK